MATEERDDADGDDNRIQFGSEYNGGLWGPLEYK